MEKLRIAKELSFPPDAVTQKFAWLGRTGSGKTFACKRMVEQMLRIGAQVVILDGSGGWAGLRLGPKAFKIPVLGGLYGDIPLESTGGALVADVIVDRGTSMILDVSQMLDAERTRFATAFAQRFFQRKKAAPSAVHLVLEECQDFVPENCQRGEEQMLHEFQRLAKQGRPHGIGLSLISQRPQEISKKALNQAECVFAFQMTGPHERKALQYWLSDKGFEGKLADVLPTLEVGAPYVWSPQWLKISEVVHILPIDSLDTSSTPRVGKKTTANKKLSPIDLKGLGAAMAETIERAKADDPKTLRAEIAKLKAELAKKPAAAPKRVEVPVVSPDMVARLEKVLDRTKDNAEMMLGLVGKLKEAIAPVRFGAPRVAPPPVGPSVVHRTPRAPKQTSGAPESSVGRGGLRRILIALAQRPSGLTNRQIGIRAGLSSQSGTFSTYLGRARSSGWIIDEGEKRRITQEGLNALGEFESLPEGDALLAYWLSELGSGGASRMLRAVADAYPNALSNEEIGEASGVSSASGTFSTYMGRLRGLELITGGRGATSLSEELVG